MQLFMGHTVSYGLHFSTSIFGLSVQHKGHELKWKKQDAITYSTDQETTVNKMFFIYLGN